MRKQSLENKVGQSKLQNIPEKGEKIRGKTEKIKGKIRKKREKIIRRVKMEKEEK